MPSGMVSGEKVGVVVVVIVMVVVVVRMVVVNVMRAKNMVMAVVVTSSSGLVVGVTPPKQVRESLCVCSRVTVSGWIRIRRARARGWGERWGAGEGE